MASIVVPANEGISVKNEHDDPEINAMALKLKENFQKSASQSKQQGAAANVYINRAGRPVPLNSVVVLTNEQKDNNHEKSTDSEDIFSIKGKFSWCDIGGSWVPYLIRLINKEQLKYVSVRIAESQLLSIYLNYLHSDIYTCTSVRSHFITEAEAKLLNEINQKHSELMYGKELFQAGKDYIVRMEDVQEFYTFIEVCYKKLLCQVTPERKETCGFIRINSESVVPYCIKDGQKYVPLFYFEGETENLKHRAVKLENWNLAYLKFCCKVQGIRNELFASDSCIVTSLDDIKNYFPPDTNFEEYWPAKVVDTQLLTNQKNPHINIPPAAWVRAPPALINKAPAPDVIPHSLPPPPPVIPSPSMPLTNSTYQTGWQSGQMIGTYSNMAHQMPTRGYSIASRNSSVSAAQYYNSGSVILQNGSINGTSHVPPPPLVRAGITTASPVSNAVPYSNNTAISQALTTIYNTPLSNSNNGSTTHSNQMRHYYNSQRSSNNGQALQQLHLLQQQQITNPQSQPPSYSSQSNQSMLNNGSTNARITNTQQRNALRSVTPNIITQNNEIIDLSSPPSSPVPQTVVHDTNRPSEGWVLKRIPERSCTWANDPPNSATYKIQKAQIQGIMIHCINAKPYIYSDLMVTLDDLVQTLFPTCSVARCAHILQKYLKVVLYSGNSEQMTVLRENGRLKSLYPDDTPLAMLQDIIHVVLQLKHLVTKQDEHIIQYQLGGSNKRQRIS